MELIRNCVHFSLTHVAVDFDTNPAKVIKTAFNKEGAQSIKNEYKGIVWYCCQRNISPESIITFFQYNNDFARLEVIYKDGECGKLGLPIKKNFLKVLNAIRHYNKVFGNAGFDFQHGDYSIENIIFNNEQVSWVLDWENFSNALPKEFDLLYCIMEVCFFRYKRIRGFLRNDIKAAAALFKSVSEYIKLPNKFVCEPAAYIRNICVNNKHVFGIQTMKYPFINCSLKDIKQIDSYLGNIYAD